MVKQHEKIDYPVFPFTRPKNDQEGKVQGSRKAKEGESGNMGDQQDYCFDERRETELNNYIRGAATNDDRSPQSLQVQVGQPFDEEEEDQTKAKSPSLPKPQRKSEKQSALPAYAPGPAIAHPTADYDEKKVDVEDTVATGRVLILTTNIGRNQKQNQERALMLLDLGGVPFETMDGTDPTNKVARTELFQLSGMRGVYPQFFVVNGDQKTFLGDFDTFEAINDATSLPAELLEANPTVITWDRIPGLARVKK